MSKVINVLMAIWALLTLRLMVSLVVLAVVLFLIVPAVGAQDVGAPVESGSDVIAPFDPATIIKSIEVLLAAVLGGSVTAFPTTFFTGLLKIIPAFKNVGAKWMAFGVAGVLTLIATVAAANGRAVQFNNLMGLVEQIGPALALWIATLTGSTALYTFLKWINAPVVGDERPGGGVSERLRRELGQG